MHAGSFLACGISALIWWLEWTVPTYHVRGMRYRAHHDLYFALVWSPLCELGTACCDQLPANEYVS